ncbi:hypothetical protein NQ315_017521 [Exocentrus adspersus]|uniref:DUF5641 domain-containing protein n=1 Tax=Exocentrus adspersus TaxID=1586481 RepID=A0AAV8VK66_9CUCU|nr:hypothetical protein NQ315_017521 [Exocentrus adspersus]
MNARPLTYISEDPKDLVVLSPSMFLNDQKSTENSIPCGDLRARFRTEYLGQLKLKCNEKTGQEIAIGDLVFVREGNSKRMDWPIARVVEVFPGRDGRIQFVRVKTAIEDRQ